jgi:TonB family protein
MRDLPPTTLPDSLRSVLAAAGIGVAPTEEPVVPDPEDGVPIDVSPDPVLVETVDLDLAAEPALEAEEDPDEPDEPVRLDAERAVEPAPELAPPGPAAVRPRGPVASFAVHAALLLAFFDWPALMPVDPPQPIPVALVVEKPPEKAQDLAPPAPSGHLASDDFGDVKAHENGSGAPAPAEAPKTAATPPPPPPLPQEKPPEVTPKPAKERLAVAIPPPRPKPTPPPAPVPAPDPQAEAAPVAPPHDPEPPHRAPHAARYPGPAATRDEYLAYLLKLTKQHFDLLPMTALAGRSGETIVTILVLADGTLANIAVSQTSGYADLDRRVEQMVAAVGKFPPLPQWYQGPRVELNLRLRFPEALEEE